MTSDQFVFWLKGLLKGMKFGNEKTPLAQLLEEELNKIGNDKPSEPEIRRI
jgi:hypothetical protein